MGQRSEGEAIPRVNPFAFPSDSDFRLALLLVLILSGTVSLYVGMALSELGGFDAGRFESVAACIEEVGQKGGFMAGDRNAAVALPPEELWRLYQECATQLRDLGIFACIGILVVILLAVGIYAVTAAWTLRRGRLRRFPAERHPEVASSITDAAREMQVARHPVNLWNPLDPRPDGAYVFSNLQQHHLVLTGGLVALFHEDPGAFRAIVRHELAHLREGDAMKTQAAAALWWAFVIGAIIPYMLVITVWSPLFEPMDYWSKGWRIAILAAVVFLVLYRILRLREIHADFRAAEAEGSSAPLMARLALLQSLPEPLWRRVWRPHPTPKERMDALRRPEAFAHLSLADTLAIGIAVGSGALQLLLLTSGFLPSATPSLILLSAVFLGPPALVVGLSLGVLGVAFWRSTFLDLVRGRRAKGACRTALGVALGTIAALPISLFCGGAFTGFDVPLPWPSSDAIGFRVVWPALATSLVLYCAFFLLFLLWIKRVASAWLEPMLRMPSPRPAVSTCLLLSTIPLGLVFSVLFALNLMAVMLLPHANWAQVQTIGPVMVFMAAAAIVFHPFGVPAYVALWALPLVGMLWPRPTERAVRPGWAFLDRPTPIVELPAAPRMLPWLAALIGIVVGSAFVLAVPRAQLALELLAILNLPRDKTLVGLAYLVLTAIPQAAAAAIVALLIPRHPLIHALLAAFATAGILVVADLTWIRPLWFYIPASVMLGMVCALPAVLLARLPRRLVGVLSHSQRRLQPRSA